MELRRNKAPRPSWCKDGWDDETQRVGEQKEKEGDKHDENNKVNCKTTEN